MQTCKYWIMGSITFLTVAGCGDAATATLSPAQQASAAEALLPTSEASAVRAASQLEFNAMELARLALHRSRSGDVLEFAQNMLDEHTRSRRDLRRAAGAHGFKVAAAMDTQGQTTWSALFVQSGKPFDAAFSTAVRGLQEQGVQSVKDLQALQSHTEIATWCESAIELWQGEQQALGQL